MRLLLDDQLIIHPSVWIAPSAVVLGHVSIGENSSVWFQCLLRGDTDQIVIGADCNIQDGSVLHNMEGYPLIMGDRVSFGHCVMAHGCQIGNDVLVGIRATILNGAVIGNHCLIAAGAMVTENAVIPDHSLVMGSPAKVVGQVSDKHGEMIAATAAHYVHYSRQYKPVLPGWEPLKKCL